PLPDSHRTRALLRRHLLRDRAHARARRGGPTADAHAVDQPAPRAPDHGRAFENARAAPGQRAGDAGGAARHDAGALDRPTSERAATAAKPAGVAAAIARARRRTSAGGLDLAAAGFAGVVAGLGRRAHPRAPGHARPRARLFGPADARTASRSVG